MHILVLFYLNQYCIVIFLSKISDFMLKQNVLPHSNEKICQDFCRHPAAVKPASIRSLIWPFNMGPNIYLIEMQCFEEFWCKCMYGHFIASWLSQELIGKPCTPNYRGLSPVDVTKLCASQQSNNYLFSFSGNQITWMIPGKIRRQEQRHHSLRTSHWQQSTWDVICLISTEIPLFSG